MSIHKKIATAIGVVGLAVAGLSATTAPASADDPGSRQVTQPLPGSMTRAAFQAAADECNDDWAVVKGAAVCFEPWGDELWICDTAGDGHHPVAHIKYGDDYGKIHAHPGNGYCAVIDDNLVELTDFRYQAEVWEGDDFLRQGAWVDNNTSG